MKKLLSILLMTFSLSAFAGQVVPIVWPFSPGANQVNFIRAIADEANRQQTKYTFVLDNKTGAGGAVAAQHVLAQEKLTILSSSGSFYIRPQFYPKESHKLEDFKPVLIECIGQPYAVTSVKFKTLDELRGQERVTIGANLGSLTEAIARELQLVLPGVKVDVVPFSTGTQQPKMQMLAGVIDLNVDLPDGARQWIEEGKMFVIGSSGTIDYPNWRTFSSQGVKGFGGLVSNYGMYVKGTTDPKTVEELHTILRKAAKASPMLQEYYARDYCTGVDYDLKKTNEVYAKWLKYWPEKLKPLEN